MRNSIVLMLLGALLSPPAFAAFVQIRVSGNWSAVAADSYSLDGANFEWQGVYDTDTTPVTSWYGNIYSETTFEWSNYGPPNTDNGLPAPTMPVRPSLSVFGRPAGAPDLFDEGSQLHASKLYVYPDEWRAGTWTFALTPSGPYSLRMTQLTWDFSNLGGLEPMTRPPTLMELVQAQFLGCCDLLNPSSMERLYVSDNVSVQISEYVAPVVPTPPAAWLFSSALGLLGVVKRWSGSTIQQKP